MPTVSEPGSDRLEELLQQLDVAAAAGDHTRFLTAQSNVERYTGQLNPELVERVEAEVAAARKMLARMRAKKTPAAPELVAAARMKARAAVNHKQREAQVRRRAQENRTAKFEQGLHADLQLLRETIRAGSKQQADNLVSYLRDEARKGGPELVKRVELHLSVIVPQARPGQTVTKPQQVRETFTCRFCGGSYRWAVGVRSSKGRVCQACHTSVMCPGCENRRPDGFDQCFKCNPNRGLSHTARPNPFRN